MARPKRAEQVADLGICDVEVVDIGRVRTARAALPDVAASHALAGLFGALGDPTRLRIVAALAASELCVCDLAAAVGLSSSAASHQLPQAEPTDDEPKYKDIDDGNPRDDDPAAQVRRRCCGRPAVCKVRRAIVRSHCWLELARW